jgi:sigma-B regulation protein RsbU (phosphoserine phosphatase)
LFLLAVSALVCTLVLSFAFTSLQQLDTIYDRSLREARTSATEQLVRLGTSTAANAALSVRPSYLDNNFAYLQDVMVGLTRSDESVRYAVTLDASGNAVATGGKLSGHEQMAATITAELKGRSATAHVLDPQKQLLLVGARVTDDKGERIGDVLVGYDTRSIEARLAATQQEKVAQNREAVQRTAIAGIAVLIIGIITAILLAKWFSRPVTRLAQAASTLAIGDFQARAQIAGPRELQQLGQAFNDMAVQLESSIHESIAKASQDRELALARTLQMSMMPPDGSKDLGGGFEICSWYSPAGICGGDWWSYYALPSEGKILVLIGDVMGHGVPAAFVTAAAKAACETAVAMKRRAAEPVELLEAINSATLQASSGKMTMSCLASLIDLRQQSVVIAGGGHPWPLLVQRENDGRHSSSLMPVHGTLLGENQQPNFNRSEAELREGSLVVWFTDGLVEATNPLAREYGVRRLRKVVEQVATRPLDDVLMAIRADLEAYTNGVVPADDVAVIVGRYRAPAA